MIYRIQHYDTGPAIVTVHIRGGDGMWLIYRTPAHTLSHLLGIVNNTLCFVSVDDDGLEWLLLTFVSPGLRGGFW